MCCWASRFPASFPPKNLFLWTMGFWWTAWWLCLPQVCGGRCLSGHGCQRVDCAEQGRWTWWDRLSPGLKAGEREGIKGELAAIWLGKWLVGGDWNITFIFFLFFHILGTSSSQLTKLGNHGFEFLLGIIPIDGKFQACELNYKLARTISVPQPQTAVLSGFTIQKTIFLRNT